MSRFEINRKVRNKKNKGIVKKISKISLIIRVKLLREETGKRIVAVAVSIIGTH